MLEQQMELFKDGGLKDEGGEIDEVSGNEVPIGGTKKGVRDDVPAMVSEGEFVFPEDVTRYIGLDKLMQMRQEAKMGLKRMEAMGQMGNGDEATIPDDLPFDMADLIIVAGDTGEELEMQEGGFVTRPTTARRTEQQPTYAQPTAERPPEFRSTRALTPAIEQPQRSAISFKDLMNEAFLEFKEYRNEQGHSLLVAFIGDKPVYNIPAGYTLYDPEAVGEEPNETVEELNEVLKQTPPEPDKVDSGFTPDPRSEFQRSGSWDNAPLDMYIKEASKFTNGSTSLATGLMGAIGGPVLGGAMYLGTKMQKKKILETIDARIEEARGTPIAGQVAALQQIKKQLEEGGGGLLDSVVDVVTNIFAPEEVKTKATNAANVDAGESATVTTDAVTEVVAAPEQTDISTITDPRIDVSTQPVLDAPYPFPDDPPPSVLSRGVDTTIEQPTVATDAFPSKTVTTEDITPRTPYAASVPIVQPDVPTLETTPVIPDKVPLATVPFKYPDIAPAKITTGVSKVTTPSPRLGYESGQDVQQSVPRYLQGTIGGQPEFYSPPQIVTTQAQTEAPSAPQLAQPEAFTAMLPKRDPSVDPTGVGKFPPLSPEAPEAVSPLPPTVDTTPVATEEPVEVTKPFVGSLDAASQYKPFVGSLDAASQYKQKTESAAPDESLRPKARPTAIKKPADEVPVVKKVEKPRVNTILQIHL